MRSSRFGFLWLQALAWGHCPALVFSHGRIWIITYGQIHSYFGSRSILGGRGIMFGFTDEEIAGYIENFKASASFSEVVFVGLLLIYMSYLFFAKC